MKLTLATNWDNKLIERINLMNHGAKNKVIEVFGSKKVDFLGSARPSEVLPKVTLKQMKNHISVCHKNNIKFNYTINAPSYHLKEFKITFRKRIVDFVSKLLSIGVDSITISNPLLIETIRENFKGLYICASTVCKIDTLRRVDWYSDLKVNRIILETDINRDFKLLKKIRSRTDIELELLSNLQCIFQCPNNTYDYVCDGFRSQNLQKEIFYNYPKIKCTNIKLKNKVEFIKSPWIRPEDLEVYQNIGIDFIKIAGREASTNWLINTANAYINGDYKGNLFDLIGNNVISSIGHLPIKNQNEPKPLLIYLENKKLKGFINFFAEEKCNLDCKKCLYCNKWVKELIIEPKEKEKYLERSNLLLEKIRKNEI